MIDSADSNDPLMQWRAIRKAVSSEPVPQANDNDQRSSTLVEQWRQFLPKECVEAMIKAGWHHRG